MESPSPSALQHRSLPRYPLVAAGVVAAIATAVLAGWHFEVPVLKSGLPGLVEMKVNTALCFILSATALFLLTPEAPSARARWVARAAAGVVSLIGALSLTQWIFGVDFGIDQLLITEEASAVMTSALGRMAPNTAVNFLCDGLALILIDVSTRSGRRPTQILCVIELTMALLALIGYIYGAQQLYVRLGVTPMGLHTAIAFVVLSTGILWARPRAGGMALVTAPGTSGRLLRRLLPVVVVAPIALAGVCLGGVHLGWYDAHFAFAAFTTACIVVIAVLVWTNAEAIRGAEEARARHLVALGDQVARTEAAYAQLQDLEQLRQDLVNMVVHDLRSPLTVLAMSHGMVLAHLEREGSPRLRELLASNAGQIDRMANLVGTLLDVSRLEAGQMPLERRPCDLADLIAQIAAQRNQGSVSIQVVAAKDARIDCDRGLIERVILNLVDNAVKASPPGSAVRVVVSADDQDARVEVVDEGPGVPEELRARLFLKFAAKRTDGQPSTGLGLAFCRLAVEAHGGRIGVDHGTGPGKSGGSRFWFTIPNHHRLEGTPAPAR